MGHNSDQDQATDFTGGASFVILLFNLYAVVGWDCAQQGPAERELLSARPIGQKAELPALGDTQNRPYVDT
jgi:hypothetical protein